MKRLLSVVLAISLLVVSSGCANVFVGGGFRPTFSSITGMVSFIAVNTVISGGTAVEVTFVTFFSNGINSSVGFCGNQSSQFPLNQMVTTNFTPGQPCATLVVVIIIT